ncbi:PIR Superfamily Protein [Plasmodium ovale curtisi]|uniref:PIR Superfamily Protein n=1 Tax=Plasmodium ovale curtisi TaxID=864141 RepID=A0A1A8XEL8_PLAOA|nr:PIR Superfamily Protein [Plasmodium ovale curtisi]
MSNNRKDFTLENLKRNFGFLGELDLYQFYDALNKSWNDKIYSNFCDSAQFSELDDPDVIALLKKLLNNIGLLLKPQGNYTDNITKSKDKQWIYVKYWLYDQLILNDFNKFQINLIFNFLEKNKNGCMKDITSNNLCNFYKLNLDDISEIKNIYDYSEFFYETNIKNYHEISKRNEYLNYFIKGFYLYKRNAIKCNTKTKSEYCEEFNEYAKIYNKYETKAPFLSCQEKLLSSLNNKDSVLINASLQEGETPKDTMDPGLYRLLIKDSIINKKHLHNFYETLTKSHEKCSNNNCDSLKNYPVKEKALICDLLGCVKNILKNWDNTITKYDGLSSKKSCDYLNYWFYDKLRHVEASPCDIDIFYILRNKLIFDDKINKNKCYDEQYYGFSEIELINKKKVFDFMEYYEEIKGKLNEVPINKNKEYCQYIKDIFELYKIMERQNVSHSYSEELKHFWNTFSSNGELNFLEEKCPDMCLYFVFNKKFKTLCPFEEKTIVDAKEIIYNSCEKLESINAPGYVDGNDEKNYNLSNLTTSSVYKELNGEVTKDKSYSICKTLLPYNREHCGIYNLCSKLVRNLTRLSIMKKKERNDRCEYITHWIYDELGKIPNIDSKNIYNTVAVREFFKLGYEILHKLDIFDCLFNTVNINLENQREEKYLHDYFKNYEKMNGDDASNTNKGETYFEYLVYINGLYEKYIGNCCYCFTSGGCMENCPDYFKCDDTYNPHSLFKTFKSNNTEKFGKGLKKVDKTLFVDHDVKWLSEHSIKVKEAPLLMLVNKDSWSTPENSCNKITCDPFYVVALGAFGLMGLFLIFFVFYKFTTLGSHFNHRGARKKKNRFKKLQQKYLEDDFEFNGTNMKNQRIRLAYHQA